MSISKKIFGKLKDGREVESWTLKGTGGMVMEVITLGGIVRTIYAPNSQGNLDDVVLGYDTVKEYEEDAFFMGVTAGRVAGRIAFGKLSFEGREINLPMNEGPNHLHGGSQGLNSCLWQAKPRGENNGSISLELHYSSPDGESGYPGEVEFRVIYTLTPDNEFIFETEAKVSEITPINLTHHSYFNLSGAGSGSIKEHELQINSGLVFKCDESMTLLDELIPVDGKASDFRSPALIGSRLNSLWQEHGDMYWIDHSTELKPIAKLFDSVSGRMLEVESTNHCLQAYFSSSLKDVTGKGGAVYPKFGAICLECHGYPQSAGLKGFGEILAFPEKPQYHKTIYRFK